MNFYDQIDFFFMVTPQDLALQTQKGRVAFHFFIIDCGNY